MDTKLGHVLGDQALAEKLIAAGFANPRQIRDADDKDLKRVLKASELERVRGKLRGKVVLFGIEPYKVELRLGLSEPLEAKLDRYVERILREIEAMLK